MVEDDIESVARPDLHDSEKIMFRCGGVRAFGANGMLDLLGSRRIARIGMDVQKCHMNNPWMEYLPQWSGRCEKFDRNRKI